ncbi:hypothetical protein [Janthinobacterium sp.]|uniref:hypothetical protein n=1 Tax=Janthinobacterium sp. TaxID=1871054 RepID=UPI00293D2338|nr:hypothetical protein [Janthinobacterium sp.]
MTNHAVTIDDDTLQALYARTSYLLRESRKTLLKRYAVADEEGLLGRIRAAEIATHPAYEHYLSARILGQMGAQVRAEMSAQLRGAEAPEEGSISAHWRLKEELETHYAQRMSEPVRLAQDALLLAFDTGLMMEVRYFSADEYALMWSWGDAELRIDTAALDGRRLCGADGAQAQDSWTTPGTDCWRNFSGLLEVLLRDPLLSGAAG